MRFLSHVLVFVAGFAACAGLFAVANRSALTAAAPPSDAARARAVRTLRESSSSVTIAGTTLVADAAAKVEPAVVNIDVAAGPDRGPFSFLRPGALESVEGAGSGIILTPDGFVATNNHVIDAALSENSRLAVRLFDGREFDNVSVVGRDPASDLAVLKIAGARDLPTARLGDSDHLRVGDWAIAVGNPLGYNSTVTLGIISALNRRGFRVENDAFDTVIQTDAAINPGSSGGPLANVRGEVVGINTAIHTPTGTNVGIGFAIPINHARRILDQLIEKGRVTRAYLGVVYQPLDSIDPEELARRKPGLRLPPDGAGALVVSDREDRPAVTPGSPAARAGLRPYDILRAIDGKPVDTIDRVRDEVLRRDPGAKLTLTVWRDGQERKMVVTLAPMPEGYLRPAPPAFR